jgi:hypothetical protein
VGPGIPNEHSALDIWPAVMYRAVFRGISRISLYVMQKTTKQTAATPPSTPTAPPRSKSSLDRSYILAGRTCASRGPLRPFHHRLILQALTRFLSAALPPLFSRYQNPHYSFLARQIVCGPGKRLRGLESSSQSLSRLPFRTPPIRAFRPRCICSRSLDLRYPEFLVEPGSEFHLVEHPQSSAETHSSCCGTPTPDPCGTSPIPSSFAAQTTCTPSYSGDFSHEITNCRHTCNHSFTPDTGSCMGRPVASPPCFMPSGSASIMPFCSSRLVVRPSCLLIFNDYRCSLPHAPTPDIL